jgi:hypothetical protein
LAKRVVLDLVSPGETLLVDGKDVRVKRIIGVTNTHVIVATLDGKVVSVPVERLEAGGQVKPRHPLAVLV